MRYPDALAMVQAWPDDHDSCNKKFYFQNCFLPLIEALVKSKQQPLAEPPAEQPAEQPAE